MSERESLATLTKAGLTNRQKEFSDALPAGRRPMKKTLMSGALAAILYIPARDNSPFHRGKATKRHQTERPQCWKSNFYVVRSDGGFYHSLVPDNVNNNSDKSEKERERDRERERQREGQRKG